jgi:hypothetical protein
MAQLNQYTYLSQVTSLILIIILYYLIMKILLLPKFLQIFKLSNHLKKDLNVKINSITYLF